MSKTKIIRAVVLGGSEKILSGPDEIVDIEVLSEILSDAIDKKIKDSRLVRITEEERVENYDSENPKWKNVTYKIPLHELKDMYKRIEGRDFKEFSLDELEEQYRL